MLDLLYQFLQTALAFFGILIFTRLIGKQQISQLTYYDYINGITIGSIAATIATDERSKMWAHFFDLTVFTALAIGISFVVILNRPIRKLLDGTPTLVVHNGKILEDNMRRMRYNLDDLLMQLREKNMFNMQDVEYAILETNGELSVVPKSQKRPLTPQDLNIPSQYEGLESALIIDGEIIHKNLRQYNLDENWLKNELQKQGITDIKKVSYTALDSSGKIYFDVHDDGVKDNPIG